MNLVFIFMVALTTYADQKPSTLSDKERGGEHAVLTCDDEEIPLDIYDPVKYAEKEYQTIDIKKEYPDAVKIVEARIEQVIKQYGAVGTDLQRDWNKMTWRLTCRTLDFVNDHDYKAGANLTYLQVAVQNKNGLVTINQKRFENLKTSENQAVVLSHELWLYKLGIGVNRDQLRQTVRAFMGVVDGENPLKEALDQIHPSLVRGDYFVEILTERVDYEYKSWIDLEVNGSKLFKQREVEKFLRVSRNDISKYHQYLATISSDWNAKTQSVFIYGFACTTNTTPQYATIIKVNNVEMDRVMTGETNNRRCNESRIDLKGYLR